MSRNLLNTTEQFDEFYNYNSSKSGICNTSHVRAFSQVILPPLYSLVFIVGFLGNGLVLCVLAKYRRRSNMMDVCLFNLALSDLMFLITLPFWAHYGAVNEWTFGGFMCHVLTGFHNLGFYGSIFFMMLMTVDRYVVTVHAHTTLFFKRSSTGVGVALVLLMWTLSLAVSLPEIIFSKVKNESSRLKCQQDYPVKTWRLASYIQLNILGLLLPLAIMGFCYSQIIPILVAMKSEKRYKAIKLIMILVIFFILCWTPYNVVMFLDLLLHSKKIGDCKLMGNLGMAMQWVETIAYSHCCLNPIIYAFVGQRFRTLVIKTLKDWFPMCFSHCSRITSQLTLKRDNARSSVIYTTTVM